ncbi:MAG: hypothetical protein JNM63_05980 [Spirochaetia bacterium]|nr:hypothetical protein [Spirochaetia bacterium]
MNPGIVIQARLASTRLPGKSLLPARGLPLIGWVLRRLAFARLPIILAVPEKELPEFLFLKEKTWMNAGGVLHSPEPRFEIFGGEEQDVLGRYVSAARAFDVDPIVRVTGDNPLTSVEGLLFVLEKFLLQPPDLAHPVGLPHGSGVEIISRRSLELANLEALLPYEREHVTPYFYRSPGRFRILPVPVPAPLVCPDFRTTVDTMEDLKRFERIAKEVPPRGGYIRLADAISFFEVSRRNGG